MEFGRAATSELNSIDFTLPPEPAFNNTIFKSSDKQTKIYVGCGKWGRKEWIGKIYPEGTAEKDFLEEYVKHFNSIEMNSTHFRIYGPDVIGKWQEKAAGKAFTFCPKFPKSISRNFNGARIEPISQDFLKGVRAFKENLGPCFLQVDEHFSPQKKDDLYRYLSTLPKDMSFFVEVRHRDWFSNKEVEKEYFETLKNLGIGAVITDVAGRRDVLHMHLTVPKAFVRFTGNHLHPTDYSRLDTWIQQVKSWIDKGLEELYFFMHHPEELESPELSDYFIKELNKKAGTKLLEAGLMGV
jgi:uncharacterized protein YecE (DUF72 family)